MLRENFASELKLAMKAGDRRRVETIRMINAALKDRDIEARVTAKEIGDEEILALLQKLVKSRQESMEIYQNNARPELAAQEREQIAVISSFLPKPLAEEEVKTAIHAAIVETGAASVKDMGKVIAALKAQHSGKMDFSKASGLVKAELAG
ncbi:GatB/YqeY domain-containing protein [uncultured Rhodoblastus sp.]|uniref:GatB/YqeY domain-containing protein n=1 Tax=uncultured Rhodoblastus sp. TaxID=543037 RepID=UPI0025F8DD93|nr:GatB/YqeY domain-containing protein [uncultured Rhodoblastus sp.]